MHSKLSLLIIPLLCLSAVSTRADRFAPDEAQLEQLRAYESRGPVAIVQLASVGAQHKAIGGWVLGSERIAASEGGRRLYVGNVDEGPPGHPLRRFELLTIDEFPSAEAAARALAKPLRMRERALGGLVVLMARPLFDRLEPVADEVSPERPDDSPEPPPLALPEPVPGTSSAGFDANLSRSFMAQEQDESLIVLELVQHRDSGMGPGSVNDGAETWVRYWNAATTRLMAHGGRPLWSALDPRVLLDTKSDALDIDWSSIELTYAPDRYAYREIFASEAQRRSLQIRAEGVERELVLPGAAWPHYDPAR